MTKQEQKDEAYEDYVAIIDQAFKAHEDMIDQAYKAYLAKCKEIDAQEIK